MIPENTSEYCTLYVHILFELLNGLHYFIQQPKNEINLTENVSLWRNKNMYERASTCNNIR